MTSIASPRHSAALLLAALAATACPADKGDTTDPATDPGAAATGPTETPGDTDPAPTDATACAPSTSA